MRLRRSKYTKCALTTVVAFALLILALYNASFNKNKSDHLQVEKDDGLQKGEPTSYRPPGSLLGASQGGKKSKDAFNSSDDGETLEGGGATAKPGYKSATAEEQPVSNLPWHHICIIGNAEKEDHALRTHQMWDGQIPSFWYIWGQDALSNDPSLPSNFHLYQDEDKKTWATGVTYMYDIAKKELNCEYFFTHDDDLQFTKRDSNDERSILTILQDTLYKHQPAVAGFPWVIGDQQYPSMKALNKKYKDFDVVPLTGFDSGMVIYHTSIVDFFIPFSPRGEGGFTGNWTLCAHFINLFAPSIFQGSAIRINALKYANMINFDNIPKSERKAMKESDNGLVLHPESRHPYEFNFNAPFKKFLSNGLIKRYQRWGREMETFDVTWQIETITYQVPPSTQRSSRPSGHRSFNKWDVLNRLASFYDLSHPILSKNQWLKTKFTDVELRNYLIERSQSGKDFRIVIHCFTMNRRASFNRLWDSINSANRIRRNVSVVIHMDKSSQDSQDFFDSYIAHLRSFTSPHGPVAFNIRTKSRGLKSQILEAWSPADRAEYGIFLEDDISVSPHFLEYTEQMIARYLHPKGSPGFSGSCMGVSLYNSKFDEVNARPWQVDTGVDFAPYVLQHPQSWGAVWAPEQWLGFIKWYSGLSENFNPLVPNSLTNRWPNEKSWKKYLIRYMYAKGKFMIYPNLPGNMSLSTNHVEAGTNEKTFSVVKLRQKFTVPLLDLKTMVLENKWPDNIASDARARTFYKSITVVDGRTIARLNLTAGTGLEDVSSYELVTYLEQTSVPAVAGPEYVSALAPGALIPPSFHLLPMNQQKVFNAMFEPVESFRVFKEIPNPESFDKCTMVMMVYNRTKTIVDRINLYHTHPLLDSIVIVWNNLDVEPPLILPPQQSRTKKSKKEGHSFRIPVHIRKSPINSLNNRFIPYPQIKTDCVVNMDDDWDMPHDHLTYAIKLFQDHFFNNLIGFRRLGRTHEIDLESSGDTRNIKETRWKYTTNNQAVSIVLPSGFVYHRKYLDMYTKQLPQSARDTVDKIMNCDDILFNMMIANATSSGPVVIDLIEKPLDMAGLWKDPSHFDKRSECLTDFARNVFGKMPLRYTTSVFKGFTKDGRTPSRDALVSVDKIILKPKRQSDEPPPPPQP
ncbi:hypothetical protein HDV05_000168 [Chytridiales sp. JEL 0842]|nr:hypothetical protein HDV05_000168 [Chytridiales sp. JEL 0842]